MSPTYEKVSRFSRDYDKLTDKEQGLFRTAIAQFVADLRAGVGFSPGLRVKKMKGHDDIWEMTWAPDGRATFHYGPERLPGEPHVVWRRIGDHSIFKNP